MFTHKYEQKNLLSFTQPINDLLCAHVARLRHQYEVAIQSFAALQSNFPSSLHLLKHLAVVHVQLGSPYVKKEYE